MDVYPHKVYVIRDEGGEQGTLEVSDKPPNDGGEEVVPVAVYVLHSVELH